jgi:starch phosphorylase
MAAKIPAKAKKTTETNAGEICPAGERVHPDSRSTVLRSLILRHLKYTLARDPHTATLRDWWISTAMAVRDHILERFIQTQGVHNTQNVRRIYYLSLEYLIGRLLGTNLYNTGLYDDTVAAVQSLGVDFSAMRDTEEDMGLGNGGLGRLAACFLDSLATHDYPAIGYGIHYEFGLFKQGFVNGHQVEHPDNWLIYGDPWEIVRPEYTIRVQIYGEVVNEFDDFGNSRPRWIKSKTVLGVPYDIPIAGYGTNTVNFLRLWASKATEEFDLAAFNQGGYVEAVSEKSQGETISKVLYPNDKPRTARSCASCSSISSSPVRCATSSAGTASSPATRGTILPTRSPSSSTTRTPPSPSSSSMRILIDEENLSWDKAWEIVTRTFGYTNHTLMPEALEKWSVPLFQRVLPRHLQIIYEINVRLMEVCRAEVARRLRKKRACSLIEENGGKMVRMANLAVVGAHAVNGVAALHTELLKRTISSPSSTSSIRANSPTRPTASPAPLAAQGQPAPRRAHHRTLGSGLGARPRAAARPRTVRRRRRFPPRIHGGQARQQGRARRGSSNANATSRSRPTRSSTCRSSACTSTSASI